LEKGGKISKKINLEERERVKKSHFLKLFSAKSLLLLPFFTSTPAIAYIQILGKSAVRTGNIIKIDKPMVIYKGGIIQGDKGKIIDRHHIIIEGHVVLERGGNRATGDYLEAYSDKNITLRQNVMFYNSQINGWIKGDEGEIGGDLIRFKGIKFSSCCPNQPAWFFRAGSGIYYRKRHYLKLYHLTLYMGKRPVLYLPWLEFPTDKRRRTGFLRPYVGFSQREGFLYSQPYFVVTSKHTDLTFIPTVRTMRGAGLYSSFRFMDSPYSKGELNMGIFRDRLSYQERYKLKNFKHYGWNFKYSRSQLFFPDRDSLYMDLKYANDVDYYYLNPKNYRFDTSYLTDKIIESDLNYLYQNNRYLIGVYNRYFIDTSKEDNGNTWQNTPQLNFHYFPQSFYNHLLLSGDLSLYNYWNDHNRHYYSSTLYLPITLYSAGILNYFNFRFSEIFYGGRGVYGNKTLIPPSSYGIWISQFSLSSSLLKKYGKFYHSITPEVIVTLKNWDREKIYTEELLSAPTIDNSVEVKLFQLFTGKKWELEHTFKRSYLPSARRWGVMDNLLKFHLSRFSLEEQNRYNTQIHRSVYNYLKMEWNSEYRKGVGGFISHLVDQQNRLRTVTYNLQYWSSSRRGYYWEESFDLNNHYRKYWLIGMKFNNHRCLQYSVSYKEARIPILQKGGGGYIADRIISFEIQLIPIGGVKQSLLFKKD